MFRVVNRGRVVQSCGLKVKRLKIKTLDIPPDDSTQLKVDLKPGTYDLYRPVDKGRGVNGAVTVREG